MTKAIYVAIGVNPSGLKEVLGLSGPDRVGQVLAASDDEAEKPHGAAVAQTSCATG
jgi:hypothetical protein